jgi:tRNA U38,U39,U40 pseudouridine synthase TruA
LTSKLIQETPEEIPAVTGRFRLQAKGFGRSMVRNLIGFVVDVSRGVIDANAGERNWTADKANMVNAAPACRTMLGTGLVLNGSTSTT